MYYTTELEIEFQREGATRDSYRLHHLLLHGMGKGAYSDQRHGKLSWPLDAYCAAAACMLPSNLSRGNRLRGTSGEVLSASQIGLSFRLSRASTT